MKLAIVHDYLNQFGGAERVVEALHETFSDAPIYTIIYDRERMPESFKSMDIRTSFMQNLPFVFRYYKVFLALYPVAIEAFRIKGYDVILSSSSAYAKGVKKPPGSIHICYCHNPMRFVWRYEDYIREEGFNPLIKSALPFIIQKLKKWDIETSKNVDYFIANSKIVKMRIKDFYGRDSEVINPPVDCSKFKISQIDGSYFLIVSRLNPYKRLELAVEVFNQLRLPLKIVGIGPFKERLQKIAGSNIEFLGRLSDKELSKYYSECRALIFPGEEDFGIVPLEAMASGRPVIAYRGGGALETIIEGKTGIFFERFEIQSLIDAVKKFEGMNFDKGAIRYHALSFDKEIFKKKIINFVEQKIYVKIETLWKKRRTSS